MSYANNEASNYDGAPATLYFFQTLTKSYAYTDAEEDLTIKGVTYLSTAISNDGYTRSGEPTDDRMMVTIPTASDFAGLFIGQPPSGGVYCTVTRIHNGDTSGSVVWNGVVKSVKRRDTVASQVTCQSLLASLNREALRLTYSRTCVHALYDAQCGVSTTDHRITTTVEDLDGVSVKVGKLNLDASKGETVAGGLVSFTHSATKNIQTVGIESYNATYGYITLFGLTEGLQIGQAINIYKGCDRTIETCSKVFNNTLNYGGFPQLPTESPFDGDPIY